MDFRKRNYREEENIMKKEKVYLENKWIKLKYSYWN